MNYSRKLENLKNRRGDEQYIAKSFSADSLAEILSENKYKERRYFNIDYPDSVKYTLGAMAEVDKAYTENTFKEGERIKSQLYGINNEGYNISFRFQGSTTNNTHIKQHSDIDILVLQENFVFNSNTGIPYTGNWKNEQISLRQGCYDILHGVYYSANVDNSGKFSISLTGGSLKRKVDVVPACWDLKKNPSAVNEADKGVRVYTKDCSEYNVNYPFYNNQLINQKDIFSGGNYRKAVRLLKTLKADSDRKIDISSYDIVSLAYHMDNHVLNTGSQYLVLVKNICDHLLYLVNHPDYFRGLYVPDQTRKISEKTTLEDLSAMAVEVGELERDLIQELSGMRKTLNENFQDYDMTRRTYL